MKFLHFPGFGLQIDPWDPRDPDLPSVSDVATPYILLSSQVTSSSGATRPRGDHPDPNFVFIRGVIAVTGFLTF